jgi:Tfp pilus assembly protein PilF
MASPADPKGNSRNLASGILLALGMIFIVAMAFLWAADTSFRFITFGIALFCFFMAFFLRPGFTVPSFGIFHDLKSDLRAIAKIRKVPTYIPPRTQTKNREKPRVVLLALVFISFVFFSIVMVVAFFPSEMGTEPSMLFQQAESFRFAGEYDSAVANYREVLKMSPADVDAYNGMATVFFAQESYDSALKYFDQVLQFDPYSENALYNKALIFFRQNDHIRSADFARQTLGVNPDNSDALVLLGDNFYVRNLYDSAIGYYEEGYDKGAGSADLVHIMAYIYDTGGKTDEAIRFYRETLEYDSTRVEVYDRLAELYGGDAGQAFRALAERYRTSQ